MKKRFVIPLKWRKHNKRRKRSNYEKLVASWLKEDKIKFKQEALIGQCHADFVIAKTVIEVNGCYWHLCTECFPNPTADQRRQRVKDYHRYQFFKSKGYNVVTIRGHELDKEPDKVRETLRDLGGIS